MFRIKIRRRKTKLRLQNIQQDRGARKVFDIPISAAISTTLIESQNLVRTEAKKIDWESHSFAFRKALLGNQYSSSSIDDHDGFPCDIVVSEVVLQFAKKLINTCSDRNLHRD